MKKSHLLLIIPLLVSVGIVLAVVEEIADSENAEPEDLLNVLYASDFS
ncbi:MAG TPA: hypothetical protein VF610_05545 [Segetibacter sp.]|jgi:hypothetical protein